MARAPCHDDGRTIQTGSAICRHDVGHFDETEASGNVPEFRAGERPIGGCVHFRSLVGASGMLGRSRGINVPAVH
ncbi:MAG TPA: hypothetical protein DDZ81_14815 [Acetobacteraceae bacterium]|nr:hypothetical protein [Acetobacteraceae bacterium]